MIPLTQKLKIKTQNNFLYPLLIYCIYLIKVISHCKKKNKTKQGNDYWYYQFPNVHI